MAKTNQDKPPINPLDFLTEEAIDSIDKLGAELDKGDALMDMLTEMGLDTSVLRERMEWSKKMRNIVLKGRDKI